MNIEWNSFIGGVSFALVFAGVVTLSVINRRHRCKLCGARTVKICRLELLKVEPNDPIGTRHARSFVFRSCKKQERHVFVQIKTVTLTQDQVNKKPKAEFDHESLVALCKIAKVKI